MQVSLITQLSFLIIQPDNIKFMCQSVIKTAATSVPAVQTKAQEICDKFTDLFSLLQTATTFMTAVHF